MELTYEQIYYAGQIIQQKLGEMKLPISTSIQIAKLTVKLTKATKPIEKERKEILKDYIPKTTEQGQVIQNNPEKMQERNDRIDELMQTEVEFHFEDKEKIHFPSKITAVCDKCKHNMDKTFEIESNILAVLAPFIEA